MRHAVLGVLVMLAAVLPARGQVGSSSPFIIGNPVQINNQPIDINKALRPTNNAMRSMNLASPQSSSFRMLNFNSLMRNMSLGTFPTTAPQVSMLPQKQNVFQPTVPKGGFNLFGGSKTDPKKSVGGAISTK